MCAAVFYCVGLFAQSYFGLIERLRDLTLSLWYILQLCEKVIGTTRNGLFEGFLFISIGMFFAFYETRLPKNLGKAIWGFTISMLLMFGEVASLTYFDFIKEKDMYLFLVPAAFFLFYIVLCIKLKDSRVYIYLRILSSLIFYMHLWVLFVIDYVSNKMEIDLENTSLRFTFTIIITIICSVIVIELSNIHKLRWLKKIYS